MRARNLVITFAVASVVAAGGIATAGWRVPGVTSSTVDASDPRLDVQAPPVSGLYPGGTVTTQLQVGNPNAYPVQFGSVSLDFVHVDANHADCPAGVLGIDFQDPHVMLVPQMGRSFDVGVTMSPDAPQACAGAHFEVGYRAEGSVGSLTP